MTNEKNERISGAQYAEMLIGGARVLEEHAQEVNDLNVFPIPDGDTGENMLLTIKGGAVSAVEDDDISATAKNIADGMLMSARGNSGVILSQFFDGISHGLESAKEADENTLESAFKEGVEYAYRAVLTPTEGTILTVIREATDYACKQRAETPMEFLDAFIKEAKRSLDRTPELLPVLKRAGVVDSGGAGIVYIADGMKRALAGESFSASGSEAAPSSGKIDYDLFGEDSVLEFGYCTELLIRLQNAKTDIDAFDENAFTEAVRLLGDSVVTVRRGSILKLHVHTKTPSVILEFCQRYGEFLNVKIENMSLQHNSNFAEERTSGEPQAAPLPEREICTVTVANGDGIIAAFEEMGADVVIDGGPSMNPSAEDFIRAFEKVNAKTILVFPNNSNSVLAAKQAASLFGKSDIRVIETRSVGQGYAALSMLDTESCTTDEAEEACRMAMEGVGTAEISLCVRETQMDGFSLCEGDYISIIDKKIAAASSDEIRVFADTLEKLDAKSHDILILIKGSGLNEATADAVEAFAKKELPRTEIYTIDGGQDIYDLIIVTE